jgi:hypothetical protein
MFVRRLVPLASRTGPTGVGWCHRFKMLLPARRLPLHNFTAKAPSLSCSQYQSSLPVLPSSLSPCLVTVLSPSISSCFSYLFFRLLFLISLSFLPYPLIRFHLFNFTPLFLSLLMPLPASFSFFYLPCYSYTLLLLFRALPLLLRITINAPVKFSGDWFWSNGVRTSNILGPTCC